ncbi:MAG: DUF6591 domain-containing protein [Sodaliphilus sp.]
MKTIKSFAIAAIAIFLASCGGKSESASNNDLSFEVSVDNTTLEGDLSEYFTVEDKSYFIPKSIFDDMAIDLKCIKPLPENLYGKIGFNCLDEDGTLIGSCKPTFLEDCSLLYKATPGQTVSVLLDMAWGDLSIPEGKTPVKIHLTSEVHEDEDKISTITVSSSSDESASSSDDTASASGGEDWDALLDSYEEYVDEYIKLMKKAENGDMSAMTEVASYMEKAQALSNKMANAKGSMSASQVARYTKILNKMASAQ